MLPASRWPRVRDPITKSLFPSMIGVTSRSSFRDNRYRRHREILRSHILGETEAQSRTKNARPYPGMGSFTTRAPAAVAISSVRSLLPLSTTPFRKICRRDCSGRQRQQGSDDEIATRGWCSGREGAQFLDMDARFVRDCAQFRLNVRS